MSTTLAEVGAVLYSVATAYPAHMVDYQTRDVPRVGFNLHLVADRFGASCRVVDVGGGIGLFSPGCARLGMDVTLVDDFRDPGTGQDIEPVFEAVHRPLGVKIVSMDVTQDSWNFEPDSLDAVTCFDSMEHWHASPKKLFHAIYRTLRPGGLFVLGTPNCVNLLKRVTVPLGFGKWSAMDTWYEQATFRGHVREPDVSDLRYIAADMGFSRVKVVGRNFMGCNARRRPVRVVSRLIDPVLKLRPSLCSDIYLVATKEA